MIRGVTVSRNRAIQINICSFYLRYRFLKVKRTSLRTLAVRFTVRAELTKSIAARHLLCTRYGCASECTLRVLKIANRKYLTPPEKGFRFTETIIWSTSSRCLPQRPLKQASRSATSGSVAVHARTTSSLGDRPFAVAAPHAWNKLPSPLRRVDSFNIFKRLLKTLIVAQAFLAFRVLAFAYC